MGIEGKSSFLGIENVEKFCFIIYRGILEVGAFILWSGRLEYYFFNLFLSGCGFLKIYKSKYRCFNI